VWREALLLFLLSFSPLSTNAQSQPPLTNNDVLLMTRSGLSDEVIVEKLRSSRCDFNTSPALLADLKAAGISDSVILEMVRCGSRAVVKDKLTPDRPSNIDAAAGPPGFAVTFVKHPYRRWRYAFRSEKYDDVSDYLETNLVKVLEQQGLRSVEMLAPDAAHCLLTIELLEIIMHPSRRVNMAVEASLVVTDSNNQTHYSKRYHGESKLLGVHQPYYTIKDAVDNMVKSMVNDGDLIKALASGKN
jgi:hypothetical protein